MLSSIITVENLLFQADKLKKKNFKPGFDKMDANAAVLWLEINGKRFCKNILTMNYEPMPAVAFASAKRGGGYRKLAKLTALDAVLHYAVLDALTPLCEELFSEFSYAYRPGAGFPKQFRDIVNSAASIAMPQSLIRKAASIISATID